MKKTFFNYDPSLKEFARKLRNKSTVTEVILWRYLKGKQRLGFDFHRQKPVGTYVVDFFCPKLKLAIEIDGISHEGKYYKDRKRQVLLEKLGVKFIRFADSDIKSNIEAVINIIDKVIKHTPVNPE